MLHIHLFGSLRLVHDEQPWKFTAIPRVRPLWVYLLLHRAAPLRRDHLAFSLQPGAAPARQS